MKHWRRGKVVLGYFYNMSISYKKQKTHTSFLLIYYYHPGEKSDAKFMLHRIVSEIKNIITNEVHGVFVINSIYIMTTTH